MSTISNAIRRLNDPCDSQALYLVSAGLFLLEICMCAVIFLKVPYTEIDWVAYMQEVEGFIGGQTDYLKLSGQTGPLVYPAGFVYIFTVLRFITGGGIVAGQVVFILLYLGNLALVLAIYARTQVVPPWALVLLCLSKRVHSIFILRMFNDCVAMMLLYGSVLILQRRKWILGLFVFSLAVSVKMNVLLYAPSLLLLLCKGTSKLGVFLSLSAAAFTQIWLGFPFLVNNASGYISRSFDFGRKFIYFWSVNFKFIPEWLFLSKPWAILLLVLHVGTLIIFAEWCFCRTEGGILTAVKTNFNTRANLSRKRMLIRMITMEKPELEGVIQDTIATISTEHITTVLFVGNFIGIVFARTLHYQFYSWYYHTIPYMLWRTDFPNVLRVFLWLAIEVIWNIYPSTAISSASLWVCHLVILIGLWMSNWDCNIFSSREKFE